MENAKPAAEGRRGAFQELLILEERVRLSGASLPGRRDFRERLPGVKLSVANLEFLVPIVDIVEILEKKSLTAIPGSAPWVKGVLNLRGRLLPVYGATEFFRGAAKPGAAAALEILVVDRGALFCGIAVDAIHGMEKFYDDELRPVRGEEEAMLGTLAGFADSVIQFGEKLVYRLNIAAVAKVLGESNPWHVRRGAGQQTTVVGK